MFVRHRNNAHVRGTGDRAMVFAHGFGCSQEVWRHVAPRFETEFVTILFDHVGSGHSDPSAYASHKYASLEDYARDVVELGRELHFEDAIFVGHSCGAMIGALASIDAPEMFASLILISPSPRYINDDRYTGGFSQANVDEMLAALRKDYPGWAAAMAPVFMGNAQRPELAEELLDSFRRTDPKIAADFGQAIFNSDLRSKLPQVKLEALVLQCEDDAVVPRSVADYVARQMPKGRLETLKAQGHFPQLCAPDSVVAAIRRFVGVDSLRQTIVKDWHEASWRDFPDQTWLAGQERMSGTDERSQLEHLLLQRAGELAAQLGRYDMYAFAISLRLRSGPSEQGAFAVPLTLRTRGAFILESMQRKDIAPGIVADFAVVNSRLLAVLARHEIAAQNSAVIPNLSSTRSNPRDWYDYHGAGNEELAFFIDAMERDILEVASLYLRLADCASAMRL